MNHSRDMHYMSAAIDDAMLAPTLQSHVRSEVHLEVGRERVRPRTHTLSAWSSVMLDVSTNLQWCQRGVAKTRNLSTVTFARHDRSLDDEPNF